MNKLENNIKKHRMAKGGYKSERSIYGYRWSYWLLGCLSVFGNRCDVTEQVGITGIGDIASLIPTLNMSSPAGELSLGHMLRSHVTLLSWPPALHRHPVQPLPNPLQDSQLSYPIWVTLLAQPLLSSSRFATLLFLQEWNWIPSALHAGGSRWKSVLVGRKVTGTCVCSHVNQGKAGSSALVSMMWCIAKITEEAWQEKSKLFYIWRLFL